MFLKYFKYFKIIFFNILKILIYILAAILLLPTSRAMCLRKVIRAA